MPRRTRTAAVRADAYGNRPPARGRSRRLDASAPYRSRRVFASVFAADSSAFGMAAGHRAYWRWRGGCLSVSLGSSPKCRR
jgi:hypothetical protein